MLVRERAFLILLVIWLGSMLTFTGFRIVKAVVDLRVPVELLGPPGIVALVVLIICRDPRRRDWSLSRTILFSTGFAFIGSVIGVAAWPNTAAGIYWAVMLACVLTCWGLYFRWRTR